MKNNTFKPSFIQWITFVFLLLPYVFIIAYLLFNNILLSDPLKLLKFMGIALPVAFISWYVHVMVNNYVSFRMPSLQVSVYRISLLAVLNTIMIVKVISVIFWVFDRIQFLGYSFDQKSYHSALIASLIFNIVCFLIWQCEYIFIKYRESASEKELAGQQLLQQEFDNLKRQINPHFLFNNFNVLSSLIRSDKQQAVFFLDELSKVYRYLLRNNEEGISTLEHELKFIRSYNELLNIRFADAINIHIDIDPAYESYLLPSLSLQLMIENAIKHNIVSRLKPLSINLLSLPGDRLMVRNNINKKIKPVQSNKVGISNIVEKYRMLNRADIEIEQTESYFSVTLPLINNHINYQNT